MVVGMVVVVSCAGGDDCGDGSGGYVDNGFHGTAHLIGRSLVHSCHAHDGRHHKFECLDQRTQNSPFHPLIPTLAPNTHPSTRSSPHPST